MNTTTEMDVHTPSGVNGTDISYAPFDADQVSLQSQDEVVSREFLLSDDRSSTASGGDEYEGGGDGERDAVKCYNSEYAVRWALIGVVGTLCCAAVYLLYEFELIDWILVWLQRVGPLAGFLCFVPAFFFVSLPIGWGYVVLNLGAGYLWGLWIGQLVVMASAAIGTFAATLLLRYVGSHWIEGWALSNPQAASLLAVINGPQAFKVVILTRLTPIPFGIQNAAFSLVHLPMLSYMTATVIGLFPTQLLNTYFGTTLHSLEDVLRGGRMDAAGVAVFAAQLCVGVVLMGAVGYAARREFNRHARARDVEMQRLESESDDDQS